MPNTDGGLEVLHIPVQQGDGKWQERGMDFFREPRDTHQYNCLLMEYWGEDLVGRRWNGREVYFSGEHRTTVVCEWNLGFLIFGFSQETILATARQIRLATEGARVAKIDDLLCIGV